MLSNTSLDPRKQKLLALAQEIADHLNSKRYAHAEHLLQQHLSPSGALSVFPKKGSCPVVEAIFFETPKKFREMFSADKPAEQHDDLYFTLLESIKDSKLATASLFEINADMKKQAQAKLEYLRDYAEVLGKKACPDKQSELMEIYDELQPILAGFNTHILKIENHFAEKIHQLEEATQQRKLPHIENRQKMREQALQHRQTLEEKRASEGQLQRLDSQVQHSEMDSLAEIELEMREAEEASLIYRDRRRTIQKLPAAEDKLKTLNFKLDVMATLHKHDSTLNEHRTSKYLRGFVNGMSLLLLGLPWLAHRALTGTWLFFNKTTSREKIEQVDLALKLDELPAKMAKTF